MCLSRIGDALLRTIGTQRIHRLGAMPKPEDRGPSHPRRLRLASHGEKPLGRSQRSPGIRHGVLLSLTNGFTWSGVISRTF